MGNKILLMGVFSHRLPRRFQMKQEFSAYQDQTGNSLVVLLPKEFSNCIFIYTVTSDCISNKTLFFNLFIYFLEVRLVYNIYVSCMQLCISSSTLFSVLTTRSSVSFHHHTVDPIYPFRSPSTPTSSLWQPLCIYMFVFVWCFHLFLCMLNETLRGLRILEEFPRIFIKREIF